MASSTVDVMVSPTTSVSAGPGPGGNGVANMEFSESDDGDVNSRGEATPVQDTLSDWSSDCYTTPDETWVVSSTGMCEDNGSLASRGFQPQPAAQFRDHSSTNQSSTNPSSHRHAIMRHQFSSHNSNAVDGAGKTDDIFNSPNSSSMNSSAKHRPFNNTPSPRGAAQSGMTGGQHFSHRASRERDSRSGSHNSDLSSREHSAPHSTVSNSRGQKSTDSMSSWNRKLSVKRSHIKVKDRASGSRDQALHQSVDSMIKEQRLLSMSRSALATSSSPRIRVLTRQERMGSPRSPSASRCTITKIRVQQRRDYMSRYVNSFFLDKTGYLANDMKPLLIFNVENMDFVREFRHKREEIAKMPMVSHERSDIIS